MYELININKSIGEKKVLTGINLKLPNQGLVIIKGENGAGKSTLLNILGTLDKPSEGSLIFNNNDLSKLDDDQLIKYRENYISFIFQDNNLFDNSTVKDNINIVGQNEKEQEIVNMLNIKHLLNKKAKDLSGGEKQRVAIARALVKDSQILLADEPTSSLDYETKKEIFSILKEISKERLVILITHDIELINNYADRVIELQNGTIINDVQNENTNVSTSVKVVKNNFNSLKFAMNNMFLNKKKLITSGLLLLLSFIFIFFSVSLSSLNFVDFHTDTLMSEKKATLLFKKNQKENNSYYTIKEFSSEDIEFLNNNKISEEQLKIGRSMNVDGVQINFSINYNFNSNKPYYSHTLFNKISFFNITDLESVDLGRRPLNNNEIVISSYLADLFIEYGVMNKEKDYYKPKDYESLLKDEELIILGTNYVKIVGIYNLDLEEFQDLKKSYNSIPAKIENKNNLLVEIVANEAGNIYVTDDFFDIYSNIKAVVNKDLLFKVREDHIKNKSDYLSSSPIVFDADEGVILYDETKINELQDNEIIVNDEIINELRLNVDSCIGQKFQMKIVNSFSLDNIDTLNLTIKGISKYGDYYMNEKTLENAVDKKIYINKVFLNESNKNKISEILHKFPIKDNDYTIETNYSHNIEGLMGFCKLISFIFKIITPIFILLSIIILINYILNSIDLHLKEIVTLKSLGVKERCIQFLFVIEVSILVIFSYILSLILFLILRLLINGFAKNIFAFAVNIIPIHFSIFIIILVFILAFLFLLFYYIQNKTKKLSPQLIHKIN